MLYEKIQEKEFKLFDIGLKEKSRLYKRIDEIDENWSIKFLAQLTKPCNI